MTAAGCLTRLRRVALWQDRLYEGDDFRAEIRYATILNALFVICFYRCV